ncbi:hypothetical protein CPB85DRAFT_1278859, partial [Mucidula mucida]
MSVRCVNIADPPLKVSIEAAKDEEKGYKFHAAGSDDNPWHYECVEWRGPEDLLSVTFTKIGDLMEGLDYQILDEYLKPIPMEVPNRDRANERSFTCRVWFKEAVRRLNDSGLFVQCEDVDALEMDLNEKACAVEYGGEVPRVLETKHAQP